MRHTLRKVVIILGFSILLGGIGSLISPRAQASYGAWDALETIGIAAGIGTVIGVSTLAFYESPTAHMQNVFMGAGAGLIVGLGVAAYLLATDTGGNEIDPEELLPPENKPKNKKPDVKPENKTSMIRKSRGMTRGMNRYAAGLNSVPATLLRQSWPGAYAPQGWTVAFNVLELRF